MYLMESIDRSLAVKIIFCVLSSNCFTFSSIFASIHFLHNSIEVLIVSKELPNTLQLRLAIFCFFLDTKYT